MLLLLGLAGCTSERPHRGPLGVAGPEGEAHEPRIPRMEAQGLFFAGQIEVEALLARAGVKWSRTDQAESSSSNSAPSNRGGGRRGGFGVGGSGGGMRGGYGSGRGGGRGERGESGGGNGEEGARPPPIHAINQAPIALRLRLTNHGAAPVDIEVVDFDSVLGDFAVQPEKITVNPGEAVEAEPMVSRLGVPAEEVPLTVKLHVGDRTEQQVITLRAVKEPPSAAAPAPSGPAPTVATPAPAP